MSPLHSVSVTGIVKRDDSRVLVIKRPDDGLWVPPGGVMEIGETPQEAMARELEEETGYLVTVPGCRAALPACAYEGTGPSRRSAPAAPRTPS
jgi:8-oxo-dGTP pyrophosphatase MutT (NUDIX family)